MQLPRIMTLVPLLVLMSTSTSYAHHDSEVRLNKGIKIDQLIKPSRHALAEVSGIKRVEEFGKIKEFCVCFCFYD